MITHFNLSDLTIDEQQVVTAGFIRHSQEQSAPPYSRQRLKWVTRSSDKIVVGALTADVLWDWIYIDELWIDENLRGKGLGKELLLKAEEYARDQKTTGIWLWTQSWQAADFYARLGYAEFTRFADFPKGYARIGLRKYL